MLGSHPQLLLFSHDSDLKHSALTSKGTSVPFIDIPTWIVLGFWMTSSKRIRLRGRGEQLLTQVCKLPGFSIWWRTHFLCAIRTLPPRNGKHWHVGSWKWFSFLLLTLNKSSTLSGYTYSHKRPSEAILILNSLSGLYSFSWIGLKGKNNNNNFCPLC